MTRPPEMVVVVVDDDPAMRESIDYMLAAERIETQLFASAEALLQAGMPIRAGCVLTDVRLGQGLDGLALLDALRIRGVTIPVLVMTGHADVPLAVRAMRGGALDFIEKPFHGDRLLHAVRDALARPALLPLGAMPAQEMGQARAALAVLTPREREVLEGLVAGLANKAVAYNLGISPRTVETYRASIMIKLGCRSFADVVRVTLLAGMGA
jgi:two-component system response regulator FixJ